MSIKSIWHFIWYDDSILSWIVNVILALVLVKFIIYPGLGLILGTTHPLVAVVSGSMDHEGLNFDDWWEKNKEWYKESGITKEDFKNFDFKNGFSKGDIMVLIKKTEPKIGDVIVYNGRSVYPIIHRVVIINEDSSFILKGDHNSAQDPVNVPESIGKAVLRIPYLGYIKIIFVDVVWNKIL